MDVVNAIAKVRFGSAKPQRVQLRKGPRGPIDLLCMEPGQRLKAEGGRWAYYVVTGTARVEAGGAATDLSAGQLALTEAGEGHTLCAAGEQRLICLAIGEK
jgi:quercetin dioxygenase-like cupin family protein